MRRHQEEHMGRTSNYSESYKREAVAKAEASGNVSQTARELGISIRPCTPGSSNTANHWMWTTPV
jgi:hypothetical protein